MFRFVDIVGNIVGMVQSYPSVTYDLCKEIEFDRHFGESEQAAESVTTADIETAGADEGAADEAVA